jgi:selenocysteine lyase/cysteine desulfurase
MQPSNGTPLTFAALRSNVLGIDHQVPLLNGTFRRYVFLDNAASTPTFRRVMQRMEEFLPWYSGVHRGVGFKAVLSTNVYEQAHHAAGEFVGADPRANTVIFVKNSTEALNKITHYARFGPDDIVLATGMEHHSNDLPWRKVCRVVHAGILPDGSVDVPALKRALAAHAGKVKFVAVTGAANVTGICNPIHDIAEWAHEAGAKIVVDAAQLVPHRPVNVLPNDDPRHLDFLVYSAHKMYAPFGIGVLVGPRDFFEGHEPDIVGGGTVGYVGFDEVEWAGLPQKEEAGSPNVVGAVALAEAINILRGVGMAGIAAHEQQLLAYALTKMKKIPGVRIYGPTEDLTDKVGVIPFAVAGMDHALVATILSAEGGIGVRNGNFCAQPYMRKLLNVSQEEEKASRASRCDAPMLPGLVRASFGCYTNEEDIDIFVEALEKIAHSQYEGTYTIHPETGMYMVEGYDIDASRYFRLFNPFAHSPAGEEVA